MWPIGGDKFCHVATESRLSPQPSTLNPKPQALTPRPQTPNPQPKLKFSSPKPCLSKPAFLEIMPSTSLTHERHQRREQVINHMVSRYKSCPVSPPPWYKTCPIESTAPSCSLSSLKGSTSCIVKYFRSRRSFISNPFWMP